MKSDQAPVGMRVRVYRNLHTRTFSVQCVKTGRVISHTNNITLYDATFVVRHKGRERVIREKRKNVHAFVVGLVANNEESARHEVKYNPYAADYFWLESSGQKIVEAKVVSLKDNKIFV